MNMTINGTHFDNCNGTKLWHKKSNLYKGFPLNLKIIQWVHQPRDPPLSSKTNPTLV
jgi:hypothetical protein